MDTSQTVRSCWRQRQPDYQRCHVIFLEESLGQLDTVQAQLVQDEQDLQGEIAQLQEELRLQQDPSKLQEMISVCPARITLAISNTLPVC